MRPEVASRGGRCSIGRTSGMEAVRKKQKEVIMYRLAFFASLAVLVTSCSKGEESAPKSKPTASDASHKVVLKVDGMQRGEGGKT